MMPDDNSPRLGGQPGVDNSPMLSGALAAVKISGAAHWLRVCNLYDQMIPEHQAAYRGVFITQGLWVAEKVRRWWGDNPQHQSLIDAIYAWLAHPLPITYTALQKRINDERSLSLGMPGYQWMHISEEEASRRMAAHHVLTCAVTSFQQLRHRAKPLAALTVINGVRYASAIFRSGSHKFTAEEVHHARRWQFDVGTALLNDLPLPQLADYDTGGLSL